MSVDELITMVNITLGHAAMSACAAGDKDGNHRFSIDELLTAVNRALERCEG